MADEKKEKLINAETADRLIAAHDGDVALYCLFQARFPGADDETAAAVLCRTGGEIAAAREKLERVLYGAKKAAPPPPPETETQFTSGEIVRAFSKEEWETIRAELERVLGDVPSKPFYNTVNDISQRLGMPIELILLLINYCDAETRRRWGKERRLTPHILSKEAQYWAEHEIMTLELAEKYIARREKQREDGMRILALLGVRGREPGPSESKYIESWLEMGFPEETIALALDRTLVNTGALKWAYLNGILKRWHEAGLHGADEVEQAEGKRRRGRAPARGNGHGDPVDDDSLKGFMGESV